MRVKAGLEGVKLLSEVRWEGLSLKFRPSGLADRAPFGTHHLTRLNAALWYECLSRNQKMDVKRVICDLGLKGLDDSQLLGVLKKTSDFFFKHHGDAPNGRSWRVWVGTDTWFGAATEKEEGAFDEIASDVQSWVDPRREDVPQWDERRDWIGKGFRWIRENRPVHFRKGGWTISEMIQRPSEWMANGASSGIGISGTRKTKASAILRGGAELIKNQLYRSDPLEYNVYIKNERKKNRGTVAAGDSVWLQMVFVFRGLKEALSESFPTSVDGGVPLKKWVKWCQRLGDGRSCGMPIDQSGFDHVPTVSEVHGLLSYLVDQARQQVGWTQEQEEVSILLLARLLDGGEARFKALGKERRFKVRHGILSGWYVTATLDTFLNVCEWAGMCVKGGVSPEFSEYQCFQGDDVNHVGHSFGWCTRVAEAYRSTFDVHPSKFWIRTDAGEFLRNVYGAKDGLPFRSGYLARSIPSMFYAQRWSDGGMTARSLISSWSDLCSRAGPQSVRLCLAMMESDLRGFLGESSVRVRAWLSTPTPFGGGGVYPPAAGQAWFSLTEKDMGIQKNEYDSGRPRTGWDELSAEGLREIRDASRSFAHHLGLGPEESYLAMDALVSGLVLKRKQKQKQKETLVPIARPKYSGKLRPSRRMPNPPRLVGDPFWYGPVLLQRARDHDLGGVLDLVSPLDRTTVTQAYHGWSRNVWMDWLVGRLPTTNPQVFGRAKDVCGSFKRPLLVTGGHMTRERLCNLAWGSQQLGRLDLLHDKYLVHMAA